MNVGGQLRPTGTYIVPEREQQPNLFSQIVPGQLPTTPRNPLQVTGPVDPTLPGAIAQQNWWNQYGGPGGSGGSGSGGGGTGGGGTSTPPDSGMTGVIANPGDLLDPVSVTGPIPITNPTVNQPDTWTSPTVTTGTGIDAPIITPGTPGASDRPGTWSVFEPGTGVDIGVDKILNFASPGLGNVFNLLGLDTPTLNIGGKEIDFSQATVNNDGTVNVPEGGTVSFDQIKTAAENYTGIPASGEAFNTVFTGTDAQGNPYELNNVVVDSSNPGSLSQPTGINIGSVTPYGHVSGDPSLSSTNQFAQNILAAQPGKFTPNGDGTYTFTGTEQEKNTLFGGPNKGAYELLTGKEFGDTRLGGAIQNLFGGSPESPQAPASPSTDAPKVRLTEDAISNLSDAQIQNANRDQYSQDTLDALDAAEDERITTYQDQVYDDTLSVLAAGWSGDDRGKRLMDELVANNWTLDDVKIENRQTEKGSWRRESRSAAFAILPDGREIKFTHNIKRGKGLDGIVNNVETRIKDDFKKAAAERDTIANLDDITGWQPPSYAPINTVSQADRDRGRDAFESFNSGAADRARENLSDRERQGGAELDREYGISGLNKGGMVQDPGLALALQRTAQLGMNKGGSLDDKISKIYKEGYKAPGQAYAIAKSMGYNTGGLVDQIKQHEGFRDSIYLDTQGYPTVGYGHKLPASYANQVGQSPFSNNELDQFLQQDIETARGAASRNFNNWNTLPMGVQDALVNQAYQLGGAGQAGFTSMIDAVQSGDWNRAAQEALNSRWNQQTPTRSNYLADVFRGQLGTGTNYPNTAPMNKPVSTYDTVPEYNYDTNYSGSTYDYTPAPTAPSGPSWGDQVYAPSPEYQTNTATSPDRNWWDPRGWFGYNYGGMIPMAYNKGGMYNQGGMSNAFNVLDKYTKVPVGGGQFGVGVGGNTVGYERPAYGGTFNAGVTTNTSGASPMWNIGWKTQFNRGGPVMMQEGGMTPNLFGAEPNPMAREGMQHDNVPAMMTPGEFVLDADSTHAINQIKPGMLESLNNWEPKDGPGMLMSLFDSLDDVTMAKTDKMGNKITVKSPEGTRMKTMFG